jgi:hypothetical protein
MNQYNFAFFGLYENFLQVMIDEIGLDRAMVIFTKTMEVGLKRSYDLYGFIKGNPESFSKVIKERDNFVGIKVSFPEVSQNKIVYRFHTDPFPNLKGIIDYSLLDKTYLSFKINYLLGEGWVYNTKKHIWLGDQYSEYIITRD